MPAHHAGKKRPGGNRGASPVPAGGTPPLASLLSVLVGLARLPRLQLLLGLVLADAVRALDLADQLVAVAGDPVQVVVGELAPLLLHFALRLLPVALDAIPVHCEFLPLWCCRQRVRYTDARDRAMPPDSDGEGRSNDDARAKQKKRWCAAAPTRAGSAA